MIRSAIPETGNHAVKINVASVVTGSFVMNVCASTIVLFLRSIRDLIFM